MMRVFKYFVIIVLFTTADLVYTQSRKTTFQHISEFHEIATLPIAVKETSGIIFFRDHLWTFNDSGDGPFIYSIDTLGKAVNQIIKLSNGKNTDWEDITQDEKYIYIGDFGNNYGLRQKLTIYRINKKLIPDTGNSSIEADSIIFSYRNMPKPGRKLERSEYDCEAMICYNDTMIIFSKNWQKPLCRIYFIPAKPGKYEVEPAKTLAIDGIVTGATLSPDKNKVLLIGLRDYSPFIYVLNNFQTNNITLKKSAFRYYDARPAEQTEGIAFSSDNEVYITSEMNPVHMNTLFKISLR